MMLTYFVIIPILVGIIVYILPKINYYFAVLILEIPLLALVFKCFMTINESGNIHNVLGARNSVLGIELLATRLNIIFVGFVVVLFLCGFIYSLKDSYVNKKFLMLFFVLQGLLSGIFLSDDLFNIYVLLEIATVIVAILIIFKRDSYAIYDGMIYLFSQIVCMSFYLFGVGYMYKIFGVLSISEIRELMPQANPEELVLPFAFIMTAICLKSAVFPLFSWLPRAHGTPSAPSCVSAILSGLYVKNGVYLFIVFIDLFMPAINISDVFMIIGILTAVCGFVFAIAQTDIKLILAFHTISQMGLIVFGLSIPHEVSNMGAIYHIFNHAVFKSLLFLSAGVIIKKYGTRDIKQISGVMKKMPFIGMTTLIGALGITGAPFFNGSISKYFIQYGTKDSPLELILLIINMGTVISFVKYTRMLWGEAEPDRDFDNGKKITTFFLASLCIIGGVFGEKIMNIMFQSELNVDMVSYAEKSVTYFVMIVLAWVFYKKVLSRKLKFYELNKFSLNFLQIVMCMVVFFMAIASSVAIKYIV